MGKQRRLFRYLGRQISGEFRSSMTGPGMRGDEKRRVGTAPTWGLRKLRRPEEILKIGCWFFSVALTLDCPGPRMSNVGKLDSLPGAGSSAAGGFSAGGRGCKVLVASPFLATSPRSLSAHGREPRPVMIIKRPRVTNAAGRSWLARHETH